MINSSVRVFLLIVLMCTAFQESNILTAAEDIKERGDVSWIQPLVEGRQRLIKQSRKNENTGESELEAWDNFWTQLRSKYPGLQIQNYQESVQQIVRQAEGEFVREYHVAVNGDDSNSGTRNQPFATVRRARDTIREFKRENGGLPGPVRVVVHGGVYELEETIRFEPEDSGTEMAPVVYESAGNEEVVFSGGSVIDSNWKTENGFIYYTDLPNAKGGQWKFRQLFVDGQRQILARYPNFDPTDINRSGYLIADGNQVLSGLENRGDWIAYRVEIPATDEYVFWFGYATANAQLDTALKITIDGRQIELPNFRATEDWNEALFTRIGSLRLDAGTHIVRITSTGSEDDGRVNLDALAFTTNADLEIYNTYLLPDPEIGEKRVIVQAENFQARTGGETSAANRFIAYPAANREIGDSAEQMSPNDRILIRPEEVHAAWQNDPQSEVFIWATYGWYNVIADLKEVKTGVPFSKILLEGYEAATPIWSGNRYYVFNVLDELDRPGEWYLDYEKGRLYYWPKQGRPEDHHIVAPRIDRLFQFYADPNGQDRVEYITLRGFTMENTDYTTGHWAWRSAPDATIDLQNSWFCAVEECTFRNIGGYAIRLYQDSNFNRLLHNEVVEAGAGGIILTGPIAGRRGTFPFLQENSLAHYFSPIGNLIASNHIHHSGRYRKYVSGVHADPRPRTMRTAPGNVIVHHLIHDMPRNGIFTFSHYGGDIIAYNHVRDVLLETDDGGTIHLCASGSSEHLNAPILIHHNLLHDVVAYRQTQDPAAPAGVGNGVYLDNHTSHVNIFNNVIYNMNSGSVFYNKGVDNTTFNNILVNSQKRQLWFKENWSENKFQQNVIYWTDPNALYLQFWNMNRDYLPEEVEHINRNVLWHSSGEYLVNDLHFDEWQKRGFDVKTIREDPMFINPFKPEMGLQEDSPAYDLGFTPIDMSRVGLLNK